MKCRVDWIFRCDGNASIGSRHVMRCVSIANVAEEREQHCLFVMADGNFSKVIESRGYETYVLNSDCQDVAQEPDDFCIS